MLAGATCSGKTALALALAARFDAEIVGADSRQIYRDMPIGTAAPTDAERAAVAYHLVGFVDPRERYSAARFVADALAAIDGIRARGRRALVVGGTGFYVRALAGDVDLSPAYDATLRTRLAREARVHPPEVLHAWLASRDPARAAAIAPGDRYRVARALEIALGAPRTSDAAAAGLATEALESLRARGIGVVKLALAVDAATLDARIAARVDAMLAAGFVDEAERLGAAPVAADAVGYPQALAYLAGWTTYAGLREAMIRATRRYAKRQQTWFRGEPGAEPISAERVGDRLAEVWPDASAGCVRDRSEARRDMATSGTVASGNRGHLQDAYLAEAQRAAIPVTVYLVNGFQLRGLVRDFDAFTIALEYEHRLHLVYKHAVSTITPQTPLTLPAP